MQALSISDKFKATLEKIQEIIGNVGYALEPILNAFASLASSSTLVLATVGALAGLSLVRLISSISLMASQLVIASAGALTIGNVLTAGGITVAVLAGLGALLGMFQDFKKMDDGISTGYGKRMLFDEGEIFALNDKDNIIATTNPIPVNDIQSRPKGSIIVAPQQAAPTQQNVKVTPSTTVVQLELNGANIGNAQARSTYSISSNIRSFGGSGIDTSATS